MNDTCTTHRSRVPRRSFGRNKRRSDDSGRRERTRPGFLFGFCVRQSSVRGCRFYFVFVYFILLKSLMFSGSRLLLPDLRTSLHWCRNPGGRRDTLSESPRCWGGSRCRGDRAAGSSGDRQGLPEAAASKRRTGGTEGSLPCSWVEEEWLPSERERRSQRRSLLPSAMFGEDQGMGDSLLAALDRRSHHRPPGGGGASGHPPKMSSTIAWHRE